MIQLLIFKEIIAEASWEGTAFIALYDRSGLTLLHSNENLIGRCLSGKYALSIRQFAHAYPSPTAKFQIKSICYHLAFLLL
jgi:hypothetical protein